MFPGFPGHPFVGSRASRVEVCKGNCTAQRSHNGFATDPRAPSCVTDGASGTVLNLSPPRSPWTRVVLATCVPRTSWLNWVSRHPTTHTRSHQGVPVQSSPWLPCAVPSWFCHSWSADTRGGASRWSRAAGFPSLNSGNHNCATGNCEKPGGADNQFSHVWAGGMLAF